MNEAIAVRVVISALIGYLLGCISPSFLIGKRRGYDVRETGSKNAGASNTIIMAGKFAGVLVAVLDILKAAASWWIAAALFPELEFAGQIAGAACVLGHMFPFYLKFKGGKGFASYLGMILAINWKVALCILAAVVILTVLTDYIVVGTVKEEPLTCLASVGMHIYPPYGFLAILLPSNLLPSNQKKSDPERPGFFGQGSAAKTGGRSVLPFSAY